MSNNQDAPMSAFFGTFERLKVSNVIGSVVLDVTHTKDVITIVTDRGTLTMTAYGDCCSESWFESVDVDPSAIGGSLTEYEESFEGEKEPAADEWAYVKTYFGTLKTSTGRITYELRNSSNGYYGGYTECRWLPVEAA